MICWKLNILKLFLLMMTSGPAEVDQLQDWYVKPGGSLAIATELGSQAEAVLNSGIPLPREHFKAPLEGEHILLLLSRDEVGNVSKPHFYRLVVDGDAPVLTVDCQPALVEDAMARFWLPRNGRVLLTGHDALAGLNEMVIRSSEQEVHGGEKLLSLALEKEGEHRLVLSADDQLGNRAEQILTVFVDGTPPTGKVVAKGAHAVYQDHLILGSDGSLSAHFSDEASGLARWQAQVDGARVEGKLWAGPWSNGSHRAQALAWDLVGNHGEVFALDFIVDKEAPEIRWQLQGHSVEVKGERYFRGPVTLKAQAQDEVFGSSPVKVKTEQGWQGLDTEFTTETSSLQLRTSDGVANQREETVRWKRDITPSIVTISDEAGKEYVSGSHIKIRVGQQLYSRHEDNESGPGKASFGFDRRHHLPLAGNIRFDRRGDFELIVLAADQLGNSREHIWSIKVTR